MAAEHVAHVSTPATNDVRAAPEREDGSVVASVPSHGTVALAHRAAAIAELDLASRPAAFEELDAAIVAELRAIEDM